jgi:hypothetical protein
MDICITNQNDTIYQVSKFSNDEGFIKYFVYNNGCKSSKKYGLFLFITEDGVFIQNEEYDVVGATLDDAVNIICEGKDVVPALMILTEILASVQTKSN